ncbi:hypothetical protein [Nocardia fluminea]|uniref:hypothetical protein n=1 Tax=Nocardia fluminea TaxID=134984 RepID=UPI0033C02C79
MGEGENEPGSGVAFPAPRLAATHPLVALLTRCSSPAGMTHKEWRLFEEQPLLPFAPTFTALRRDVQTAYAAGDSWGSAGNRALLEHAIRACSEIAAENFSDPEVLRRFVSVRRAAPPRRTPQSDDKYLHRLISKEQNRIDHRSGSYQPKGPR